MAFTNAAGPRHRANGDGPREADRLGGATACVNTELKEARQDGLADLAARINAEHDAAFGRAREAVQHAAECGRLLLEAKAQVRHGEWLSWLEVDTKVSARQSQKYMRLADGWTEISEQMRPEFAFDDCRCLERAGNTN